MSDNVIFTQTAKPVQSNLFVITEWFEFLIELGFIPDVSFYNWLQENYLRKSLKSSKQSEGIVIIDDLHRFVKEKFRINMTDGDAGSRIETLFIYYRTLLRRYGLVCLAAYNERITAYHVLFVI